MRKTILDRDFCTMKIYKEYLYEGDFNSEKYKNAKIAIKTLMEKNTDPSFSSKNTKKIQNIIIEIIDNINEKNFEEIVDTFMINKKNNLLSLNINPLYENFKYDFKFKKILKIEEIFERFINNSNFELVKNNIDYIDINGMLSICYFNKRTLSLLINKLNYSKVLNDILFINHNSENINDLIHDMKKHISNEVLIKYSSDILMKGVLNNYNFNNKSLILFEDLTIHEYDKMINNIKYNNDEIKKNFDKILETINLKQKERIENEIDFSNIKDKNKRRKI